MLPNNWAIEALGDLTENFDSMRIPVKEADRQPGPYPYYGASGIVDYVDKYIFDGEYLLLAEDGENLRSLKTAVAFLARGRFWVNNHAHIIRSNGKSNTRFLLYALLNTNIGGYLTGSTMPKLTQGNMDRIPIVTPPLPEQRAIAHILGTLDDKIELNRRMNETLEAMARALFKSWFVDFDPVRAKAEGRQPYGMDAETAALFPDSFEDSPLGEVPRGWKVGKLRECCLRVENGGTPRRDEPEYWEPGTVPWLTSGEVRQSIVVETENFISEEGRANSSAKLWPSGTTVVALYGATAGQVCFLAKHMCANQACCGLVSAESTRFYLYLYTSSSVEAFVQQARGSAQQNLSQQIVADFPTLIPASEVLKSFENRVRPLFEKWIANLNESRTLAALCDALLPRLLSGEVRVKHTETFIGHAL